MNGTKRLALITGASSGIGFELAKVFAQNGFDLIIASDTNEILAKADELKSFNTEVKAVVADLATQEGIDLLYDQIKTCEVPLSVAALNAGVGAGGEFLEIDWKAQLNLMNLNMVYLVGLTRKILTDMVAVNEGKILFTSSIAAEMPGPYYATYAASKSFVQSFVEALRFELKEADKNITITALQPGATDTNFFARAHMLGTPAGKGKKDDPAVAAQDGYDALMAGKDHVVAGSFKNTVQSSSAKFMSEKQAAATHASSTRPQHLEKK